MNTQTPASESRPFHTVYRPEFATSFVAVETTLSKRPADVFVYGTPATLQVFPEVIVQAYAHAKIKSVEASGADNVRITIDAASIVTQKNAKLKYDIYLNTTPGTDTEWYARQALANGEEVFFAFEQRRKARNKNTGEFIPFTTPIRTLAGITDGSNAQDQALAAANLSKVLVAIGPSAHLEQTYLSPEARCDQSAWEMFSTNYDGTLTPSGFVRPTDAEGNALGCLIKADDAPDKPASPELTRELGQINSKLDALTGGTGTGNAALCGADGTIDPGSPAVAAAATATRRARRAVRAALSGTEGVTGDQQRHAAVQLSKVLLWLADKVQAEVAGATDRAAASYVIAADQVDDVMEFDLPYLAGFVTDSAAAKGWAEQVRQTAVRGFLAAVETTNQWAGSRNAADGAHTAAAAAPEDSTTASGEQRGTQGAQNAETGAEAPAAAASSQEMTSDVPDLCERWDRLIETVGMAKYIPQLNPMLFTTFGTCLTSEIPAESFSTMLSQWEADPERFFDQAGTAYRVSQKSPAA